MCPILSGPGRVGRTTPCADPRLPRRRPADPWRGTYARRVSTPFHAADLATRVQVALDGYVDAQRVRLAGVGPQLVTMVDAIGELLSGGKRLRPAFCYWGWRGAGADDGDAI